MPKVSIIIPVYNGEKYLKEAIDSAINQTYDDIEVIVCDDYSTDTTRDIILSYGDKIIWLGWNVNNGTAFALNQGIENASGDYIKWLSADDVLLPDAIENMIKQIEFEGWDEERCIFYTHYHIIDKEGMYLRDFEEPEDHKRGFSLWDRFYGNGSTTLIHKSVFEKCGLFDESLRHSEDYEFWLRATQLYGIHLALIPIFTINYRNHPDQLTNKIGGTLDKQIKDSIRKRLPAV